jgi:hypothetical protein
MCWTSILSCAVYLTLYTPNVRDVITGTQSNFETWRVWSQSGSYFLGLGMFVFFHGLYWNRGLNSWRYSI